MRNIICCLVFALESIVIHSMGYTINLETVKNIIRSFTVVIAISLYFAGWAFYIHMCSKNKEYGNAADIFYAIWTVLHLVAVIIVFVWAWM